MRGGMRGTPVSTVRFHSCSTKGSENTTCRLHVLARTFRRMGGIAGSPALGTIAWRCLIGGASERKARIATHSARSYAFVCSLQRQLPKCVRSSTFNLILNTVSRFSPQLSSQCHACETP